jgi:hypothetical protein
MTEAVMLFPVEDEQRVRIDRSNLVAALDQEDATSRQDNLDIVRRSVRAEGGLLSLAAHVEDLHQRAVKQTRAPQRGHAQVQTNSGVTLFRAADHSPG